MSSLLAGVSAAVLLTASTTLLAPAQSTANAAASAPTCKAWMVDATPQQYSNAYVKVKTVGNAYVRTVAHYKTTDTVRRGKAGPAGFATIKYYISGATPGYRVYVDVTVTGPAGASGNCRTSFLPHS